MNEVLVKFYSDIRGIIGTKSLNLEIEENENINNLIKRLCKKFPNSFLKIIYEPNSNILNSAITILINQVPIVMLNGEDTKINNGDEIIFFAAVSGG